MSDFYNENPIKATRKVHYCFECQHPIPSGDRMHRMGGASLR